MAKILDGLAVVDLTHALAGPLCTMMLGDLGADVIKIESPGHGDESRGWGPPFVGAESVYFLSINRNKRSITLDIRQPAGQDVLRQLIARADIVIENYRPGFMDRLGFGYQDLQRLRSDVIYCSISGFGLTGPRRDQPAYDMILQGIGGLMSITGTPDGGPTKIGVGIADLTAGLFSAFALMAAIHHRARTGEGQMVDTSLLAGQVALLTNLGATFLLTGQVPGRLGNEHPNLVPYGTFQTADGAVNLGCANDRLWKRFCTVLNLTELAGDPRFLANADRVRNRAELSAILNPRLGSLSTVQLLALMAQAGIPAGPIFDVGQVLTDSQTIAQGLVQKIPHATLGEIPLVGVPYNFSAAPAGIWRPPPTLGQHTDEILTSLGFVPASITTLRAQGII